jgi:hypothetical protein
MDTPKLHALAVACHNGACNVPALIRALAATINEIPRGRIAESVELKIILGQLSFLAGDSLGPNERALTHFRKAVDGCIAGGQERTAEITSVDH